MGDFNDMYGDVAFLQELEPTSLTGFSEGTDGSPEAAGADGTSRSSGKERGKRQAAKLPSCCETAMAGGHLEEAKRAID